MHSSRIWGILTLAALVGLDGCSGAGSTPSPASQQVPAGQQSAPAAAAKTSAATAAPPAATTPASRPAATDRHDRDAMARASGGRWPNAYQMNASADRAGKFKAAVSPAAGSGSQVGGSGSQVGGSGSQVGGSGGGRSAARMSPPAFPSRSPPAAARLTTGPWDKSVMGPSSSTAIGSSGAAGAVGLRGGSADPPSPPLSPAAVQALPKDRYERAAAGEVAGFGNNPLRGGWDDLSGLGGTLRESTASRSAFGFPASNGMPPPTDTRWANAPPSLGGLQVAAADTAFHREQPWSAAAPIDKGPPGTSAPALAMNSSSPAAAAGTSANGPLASAPAVGTPPADATSAHQPAAGTLADTRAQPAAVDGGSTRPKHPPTQKHSGKTFDPVQVNGKFFDGWPKPMLAMLFTGRMDGYIEPCGCAGFDLMRGGLSRRDTFIKQRLADGWNLARFDVGGVSKGFGPQANIRFQIIADAYRKMGYEALGLGPNDLKLPAGELLSAVANTPSPFVSANVGLFTLQTKLLPAYKVFTVGGKKIGVTAVLGNEERKQISNAEIQTADPEAALAAVYPELLRQCTGGYLVLLAYASRDETIALVQKFPDFHVAVTAGGGAEPPGSLLPGQTPPDYVPGTHTVLVEVGEKGKNAIVLGIYADPAHPVRYQRVALDSRFPASRDMQALMESYQDQLKFQGWDGLGLRPVTHPDQEKKGGFVGSEKCQDCHEESYKVWKNSVHFEGLTTLEQARPPRQYDPECISCHAVGWNSQGNFLYRTGFVSREKTPLLAGVGCESCHGPGEAHCKAEEGGDTDLQERLQKSMVITKEKAARDLCVQCHDGDNSPEFKFELYWPCIEHHEDADEAAGNGQKAAAGAGPAKARKAKKKG